MENSGLQKQGNLSVGSGNGVPHQEMEKSCVESTQHRGQNRWKNAKVKKFYFGVYYLLPYYRILENRRKMQKIRKHLTTLLLFIKRRI